MNLADVALEALYLLGVLMCCALLSREEGSREGLGSRRARLFMLALAVEAMQAGFRSRSGSRGARRSRPGRRST